MSFIILKSQKNFKNGKKTLVYLNFPTKLSHLQIKLSQNLYLHFNFIFFFYTFFKCVVITFFFMQRFECFLKFETLMFESEQNIRI